MKMTDFSFWTGGGRWSEGWVGVMGDMWGGGRKGGSGGDGVEVILGGYYVSRDRN